MVYRLLHVPLSPDDYTRELNIIKYIAVSNGYSSGMIDNILKKQKANKNQPPDQQIPKYVPIEYGHRLYNTLTRELKKFNLVPAPKSHNKLENLLNVNNRPLDDKAKLEKTGVYKIECSDCNNFYVG